MHVLSTLILSSVGLASAFDVPANLQAIYDAHKSGDCKKTLSSGYDDGTKGTTDMGYCGDIDGVIFLHSTKGAYADMDIDCDGVNRSAGDCANDGSGQDETAFKSEVADYGIEDLDANLHPYVVFGNEGSSPSFMPDEHGMEHLSVMAVVCGGKLHYGIWGDTNGATSTGEASISLAKLCFPNEGITGNSGHGDKDVLYIGFTGTDAVPGSDADWSAKDSKTFEASIKSLGDKLVAGLGGSTDSKVTTGGSAASFVTSAKATTSIKDKSTTSTTKTKTRTLSSTPASTKTGSSCRQD
ncbi:uncharacterized protein N7479_010009 [Penicillium vulpinum]|uniref:Endo-chitosanase n=1 Tax=Penicillium vulpinum TaxID=29845 RepID=A0A1V6REW2_9EURO|nr:uncharacterized protein N7479_010009 [Penicillium vulpinum]KAJ5951596.1 hypothetical protein N7479_010009 [Penicillium vulpinum]OQE00038.1 hypothetical protein PENVUL_c060G04924 [Penicillium vulpinum]